MPRPKGEVWKYFQELPEHQNGSLVQCLECGVRITRGSAEASRGSLNTSSMTDHLRRNHSEVLEKIENRKAEKLARFYLTLTPPPTSTFVERLFSQAGTRNTLLPETLERMMFLRSNMDSGEDDVPPEHHGGGKLWDGVLRRVGVRPSGEI